MRWREVRSWVFKGTGVSGVGVGKEVEGGGMGGWPEMVAREVVVERGVRVMLA